MARDHAVLSAAAALAQAERQWVAESEATALAAALYTLRLDQYMQDSVCPLNTAAYWQSACSAQSRCCPGAGRATAGGRERGEGAHAAC
jgi:hypothetical protein